VDVLGLVIKASNGANGAPLSLSCHVAQRFHAATFLAFKLDGSHPRIGVSQTPRHAGWNNEIRGKAHKAAAIVTFNDSISVHIFIFVKFPLLQLMHFRLVHSVRLEFAESHPTE